MYIHVISLLYYINIDQYTNVLENQQKFTIYMYTILASFRLLRTQRRVSLLSGQEVKDYELEKDVDKRKRNWEYLSVVRENINNPSVKRVVLLHTDPVSLVVIALNSISSSITNTQAQYSLIA